MSPRTSAVVIPRNEWAQFLHSFSLQHRHWPVRLETHDTQTGERVVSRQTPLQSIELDLEDKNNARINVVVELDNKTVKHILFRPSNVILHPREEGSAEALHIDAVHTATTLRFNPEQ